MRVCCCSLAGTSACLTCANSMSGTWGRYPAPYVREYECPDTYVDPEWKRQADERSQKLMERIRKIEDASKQAANSALHFGGNYLFVNNNALRDEKDAKELQVTAA